MVKARSRLTSNTTASSTPSRARASATETAGRQSTLCAGSWPRPACPSAAASPVAAERIVPPPRTSESASTAIPRGDQFGSTTVQAKVSASTAVPRAPSYDASFRPHSAGSMSIASRGVPVTLTASLKASRTRITSPRR